MVEKCRRQRQQTDRLFFKISPESFFVEVLAQKNPNFSSIWIGLHFCLYSQLLCHLSIDASNGNVLLLASVNEIVAGIGWKSRLNG